jgi:hypothetical protein
MSLYPYFSLLALFIIVPGIIFLFIFIYQSIYKRQINHALRDEGRPYRTIEPMPLVLGVVLIILMIFTISTSIKVGKLQEQLDNQNTLINQIRAQLNNISGVHSHISNLEKKLDEMQKAQEWVQDRSYQIIGFSDDTDNTLEVEVQFNLKDLAPNSQVFLSIVNKSNANDQQKVAVTSDTLNFVTSLALDITKDYEIYVLSESNAGIQNDKLMDIDLKQWTENRIQIVNKSADIFQRDGQVNVLLELIISNESKGLDDLSIVSGTYQFYNGDTLIETVDVIEDIGVSRGEEGEMIFLKRELTADRTKDMFVEIKLKDASGVIYEETLVYYEGNQSKN